jgi:hypothetical protein
LVRVQDVGLSGTDDPRVLEWAAGHERILLTHDVATITAFAYERVAASHDEAIPAQPPSEALTCRCGNSNPGRNIP